MWVMTTCGFFSVVAHRHDPDKVVVRARVRSDLEGLVDPRADYEIEHTPRADYEWRVALLRSEWSRLLAALADGIDYDNFKLAVAKVQGIERASLYARIWLTLRELQTAGGLEG